jgi:hypothetical protein
VTLARRAILIVAALTAAIGVAGGLARLGIAGAPAGALERHGMLMVCGFLGTVIGLERAVALERGWAYLAPMSSAAASVVLLCGHAPVAMILWTTASAVFVAASVAVARRQPVLHTALLVVAALAWLAGNVALLGGAGGSLEAWFAFLVITVAAERIELASLGAQAGRARGIRAPIVLIVAAVVAGFVDRVAGGLAFGAGIAVLGAFMLRHDVARRTLRAAGYARFAAASVLLAYAWLIVGGIAWIAWAWRGAFMDLAIHALALGFAFSMILAHAPLIVPAVARARMRFTPLFYIPLGLLHASLALRAASALAGAPLAAAGLLNAGAIAVFALVVLSRLRPRAA